jgi:outer membrane usher protein
MIRASRTILAALAYGAAIAGSAVAANAPADLQPAVYAVAVNGVRVCDGALLLQSAAHDLYARVDDLRAWRINVPVSSSPVMRAAVPYVRLRTIPGLRFDFDAPTQTLLLRAGPTALRGSDIGLAGPALLAVARPAGAYANYAFTQSGGSYGSSIAGEVQGGIAAFNGVIKNDLAWTPGAFSRLQTAWERDDPQRMQSIIVGDTTTTDAQLGSAIRFAGVRWGSDFSEQPQFATYPGIVVRGEASVPSQLDIYVNDVLAEQHAVPAGPYALHDVPVFDGAGTIAIRAADALGGTTQLSIPYYSARDLLRPGVASFGYSAGFLNENGTYGPFMLDASRRWGISDALTGGFMAQYAAGTAIVGADADWLAGRDGRLSFAAAASRNGTGAGALWDAGYAYTDRRLTVGGELRVASADYASLDPTALGIGHEIDLHATWRLTRTTSVQVSVARDATIAGPVSLWTAGMSGNTRGVPYTLTAYRSAGASANAFGLTAALSVPVGRRATLSPHAGTGGNSAQSQLEYAGSTGGDGANATAWDVAAGLTPGATSTARLTTADANGEVDLDVTSTAGQWAYTTSVQGGVAVVGGAAAPTRAITGAYGLVRVPGFPGVDVYVNGRFAGTTNAHGDLVTADLVPYVENEVRIDPSHLAASTHVDALVRTVVPTAFAGTIVVFRARAEIEARLTLRDRAGRPLPAGILVRQDGGGGAWPTGFDGRVDLIGVSPGTLTLHTAGPGAPVCTIRLTVPAGTRIATLPDATCAGS